MPFLLNLALFSFFPPLKAKKANKTLFELKQADNAEHPREAQGTHGCPGKSMKPQGGAKRKAMAAREGGGRDLRSPSKKGDHGF